MKKPLVYALTLALTAVILSACGLLEEPAAPSATLEAIPLETATTGSALATPATATEESPLGDDVDSATPADTAYPAEAPTADPPAAAADAAYPAGEAGEAAPADAANSAYPEPEASSGARIFTISQADSEVSFSLDEDLRGLRNTVIGTTDQVAGELSIDLSDLSTAQVGTLQVNARTLATDNNFRNRAIQNEILDTGTHEFITFTPTAVNGLPASAAIGEAVSFTIDGDLTIRGVTRPVTFAVTATAVSDSQLSGTATAVVNRTDYDLQIPQVPNVANVEEEVELTINFVANAS